MKESNFKFTNPFLSKIDFSINEKFILNEQSEIANTFNVVISRDPDENIAKVDLEIIVGQKEFTNTIPFFIDIVISSMFSWDDVYDSDTLQSLLSINAPALLLGYARPLISTITNMSPFPIYNLPFYNFTEQS